MKKTNLLTFFLSLITVCLVACSNATTGAGGSRDTGGTGGGNGGGGPTSCGNICRIFISSTTTQGNFGGITQADSICNNDANRPATNRTWKALLVGGSRKACDTANCTNGSSEHSDWVLKPNTQYIRPNGTVIGTTLPTAGIWDLAANLTNSIGGTGAEPWTGLTVDWQTATGGLCTLMGTAWTNNSDTQAGMVGDANAIDQQAIRKYATGLECNNARPFYCVEQ